MVTASAVAPPSRLAMRCSRPAVRVAEPSLAFIGMPLCPWKTRTWMVLRLVESWPDRADLEILEELDGGGER